jgi:hypothetical protein
MTDDVPQWHFADGPVRRGPFTLAELRRHPLRADTLVWRKGMEQWQPVSRVTELAAIFLRNVADPIEPQKVAVQPAVARIEPDEIEPYPEDPFAPKSRKLATASFLLAIAAFLSMCLGPAAYVIGPALSVAAIVSGVTALRRIKARQADGQAMASLGLGLAAVFLVSLIVLVGVIAFHEWQLRRG